MYPNLIPDGKTDFRNPFCEKNLIHVKFVKIRQSLLRPVLSCSDETPNQPAKTTKGKNVIVETTSENRYVFYAMVYNVYPFVLPCFIWPKHNELFLTFITLRFRCRCCRCVSVFFLCITLFYRHVLQSDLVYNTAGSTKQSNCSDVFQILYVDQRMAHAGKPKRY